MSGRGAPPNRSYILPCDFPTVWAIAILQNIVRNDECQYDFILSKNVWKAMKDHSECVFTFEFRRFIEDLIRTAQRRGVQMDMPPRVEHLTETGAWVKAMLAFTLLWLGVLKFREYIHERFKFFAQNQCKFVLLFAPGKQQAHAGDIHHMFKLMEIRFGMSYQISDDCCKGRRDRDLELRGKLT